MYAVEYIIDGYGNLTTKSGISLESQFPVINLTNKKKIQEVETKENKQTILRGDNNEVRI